MTPQHAQAAHLATLAQPPSPAPTFGDLASWAAWNAHTMAATATVHLAERSMRPRRRTRLGRFARTATRHPITTGRTCVHAAKLLPTVRQAVPWYVWPLLALAAAVKMLPLDFGTDEALFCVAFLLILWQRPGLLEALYHEAQAGKPARCQCARHARKAAAR